MWLVIDTGGPEPAGVTESLNMTSNVAPMWRKAGADIADFDGQLAGDMLPALRAAIAEMEDNPTTYRAMNPPNGWGSYEVCLRFLRRLVEDFAQHPKAIVKVWR